jgi:DNA-binding CsgD family transcriptional regulator
MKYKITESEENVWRLLASGLSDKEIARMRGCSVRTVNAQVGSIYRKTGVGSRVEAATARRAQRNKQSQPLAMMQRRNAFTPVQRPIWPLLSEPLPPCPDPVGCAYCGEYGHLESVNFRPRPWHCEWTAGEWLLCQCVHLAMTPYGLETVLYDLVAREYLLVLEGEGGRIVECRGPGHEHCLDGHIDVTL